jgi:hypothetical protein
MYRRCRPDSSSVQLELGAFRSGESSGASQEELDCALQKAWLPYSVGWKLLWWEAVAIPADVDDAEGFRQGAHLKDLEPMLEAFG